ncbi:ABC transporter permease [Prolixibacter bellariivorans]|uniref:ABC transporter permease n=2 Tax=Prolixibacter bellariivorans TaxID=314319 RepID=A0A5M4B392_9BACT|nr:ABC transporter permease [Prolixibacter bellariivorans]GET34147.1 ABC transporter permease [Prolixibacter bellariivorans]
MIKFLFKTSIRNLLKDKYQSGINILGLTFGFAAFLFIAAYFIQEQSFDRFHSKSDRLYRVVTRVKMGATKENLGTSEVPLAFTVKSELPEVIDATRFYFRRNVVVKVSENKYMEKRFWYADQNVFDLFDFKLLKGNKDEVLAKPNSVVITPELSKKYFGDSDPIGKTIEINSDGQLYEVTGIMQKIPANSHLQFDMLASFSSIKFSADYGIQQWGNFRDMYTYLLLKKHTDLSIMNKKLQDFTIKYYTPMMERVGINLKDFEKKGDYVVHSLQPLKDIHLDSVYTDVSIVHGNKQLLYALGLIGIMIIVIACFNFINLSTARATLRAKEIGVRKIIGSSKSKITIQILFETFMQSVLAISIAILLLYISLPVLNLYTGLDMQFSQFFTTQGIITISVILILVVILAGTIPSIVIAKFNPVEVIKGTVLNWNANSGLRNSLVSFQFIIFIILICGTIVVKKQVSMLHHQNPGFLKENVIVVKNTSKLGNSEQVFKDEILRNPEVIKASYSNALPSMFNGSSNPFSKTDKKNKIFLLRVTADKDFLNTLKIKLLDGRNFTDNAENERFNAIINKKAAHAFGWTDCNDKVIYDFNNGGKNYNVIGIVDDFHIKSLRKKTEPMIIRYQETGDYLAVRIRPESATKVLKKIKSIWGGLNDQAPFEYTFLDESFDNQYKQEVRFGKLTSMFSLLSVVIACMGLLGLVSFTLTRKQKEIGIRKVNGARISEVMTMLNRGLVKLVAIAFVIATPIAWFAMNKWLESFAYKTSLSWWIFALAGLLALVIALLTVSWQSWKAATRNPVEALRHE